MEIRIFNVEHGFCAYVIADNRNVKLIDFGHNSETGFRPSRYLPATGCTGIEELIVSNYDEDHLSDLPNLRRLQRDLPIEVVTKNASITADQLRNLKRRTGPIQPGMEALLDMIRNYTTDLADMPNPPQFPGIEERLFWNSYPAFEDTNNLSLVTFLHCRGIHIVFPGDLERSGWLALLEDQSFREHLSRVNLFVASHHGRQSGYCSEVFDYCQPDVIIISDESIRYDTQQVDYTRHATGVPFEGGSTRYVFTTRNDGMIRITEPEGYSYWVTTGG